MTKRTDIHRPSVIEPSEYHYVSLGHQKIEGFDDVWCVQEQRAQLVAHMERTGGKFSDHYHGGGCYVCGSWNCIYTAVFWHKPTNTYIYTGMECAEKMGYEDNDNRFRVYVKNIKAAIANKAGKAKAQGLLQEAGLGRAWEIYAGLKAGMKDGTVEYHKLIRDRDRKSECTILDMVDKLISYGSLSPKQTEFLRVLVDRVERAPEIAAERAAKAAQMTYLGTVGERLEAVVSVKCVLVFESQWGYTSKIIMEDEKGNSLVWNASRGGAIEKGKIYRVIGKVKAHQEYKGMPQTVLTRAKMEEVSQ